MFPNYSNIFIPQEDYLRNILKSNPKIFLIKVENNVAYLGLKGSNNVMLVELDKRINLDEIVVEKLYDERQKINKSK